MLNNGWTGFTGLNKKEGTPVERLLEKFIHFGISYAL
jgi:hypothetical protein